MNELTIKTGQDLQAHIQSPEFNAQIMKALPSMVRPELMTHVAMNAMQKNPAILQCTPLSVINCMMELAAIGLVPDGRRAALVPFNNNKKGCKECTIITMYQGLVELCRRDESVLDVSAVVVREGDKFIWNNGKVEHSIGLNNRGNPLAYYSRVVFCKGSQQYERVSEPMTVAEVKAIQARSRQKDSDQWRYSFDEMAKKTVVRRDSKYWPLSAETMDRVTRDDKYNFDNTTQRPTQSLSAALLPKEDVCEAKAQDDENPFDKVSDEVQSTGDDLSFNTDFIPNQSDFEKPQLLENQARFVPQAVKEWSGKSTKGPWTGYGINLPDGRQVATFSSTEGAIMKDAAKDRREILVTWKEGAKGLTVIDIQIF